MLKVLNAGQYNEHPSHPLSQSPSTFVNIAPPTVTPAHGSPLFDAVFKAQPSDFQVAEQLSIPFTGDGEHLYLHIEKTQRNTSDVVKALCRCYGVIKKDVGVSGQKDRQAVTSQWFSVRTPLDEKPLLTILESDNAPPFRCLDAKRHQKKLRLAAHNANRFVIRLTDVNWLNEEPNSLKHRVEALIAIGFPNYYGPQRFGRQGANLAEAIAWLGEGTPIRSIKRDNRSRYLSSVRSAAFNWMLNARVEKGDWNQLRQGELVSLHGTNSVFTLMESERIETEQRLKDFDVHPSVPLVGRGESLATRIALADDTSQWTDYPNSDVIQRGLMSLKVDASHRATRALCRDLAVSSIDETTLEICVTLDPGVFATTLLMELFKERTH